MSESLTVSKIMPKVNRPHGELRSLILSRLQAYTSDSELRYEKNAYDYRYRNHETKYGRSLIHVGTSQTPTGYLEDWIPLLWIRCDLFPEITNSVKASFSRAIKQLEEDKLIECCNEWSKEHHRPDERIGANYTTHIKLLTIRTKVQKVNRGRSEP
jgi:hypothetical protein